VFFFFAMNLKASCLTALVGLVGTVVATQCDEASVFMLSSNNALNEDVRLTVDQSQLVLEDFGGISRFSRIDSAQDAAIVASLRDKTSVFSDGSSAVVVVVENFPTDSLLGRKPSFRIDRAPDGEYFQDLFKKFAGAIEQISDKFAELLSEGVYVVSRLHMKRECHDVEVDTFDRSVPEEAMFLNDLAILKSLSSNIVHQDDAFVHLASLSGLQGSTKYSRAVEEIQGAIKTLAKVSDTFRIAIVALPAKTCKCRMMKSSSDDRAGHHHHHIHHHSGSRKRDVGMLKLTASSYSSLEKCEASTNSCSGHGSCEKTSSGSYQCVCQNTYDAERKKTTKWGGNACQKKDVSVETQLFLWTGLGIILTIGAGLSLLYSVGSEPLPGILSVAKRAS
jgi:hypothetical protein